MRDVGDIRSELPIVSLSAAEAGSIAELAHELARTSPTASPRRFLQTVQALVDDQRALGRIRAALGTRPHACIIRGLHAGTSEPTPTAAVSTLDNVAIPAATLGIVASIAGEHRGFERESNGRLIHSFTPIWMNRDLQISSSSSVELEMHTELAYAKYAPDFVVLLCVKRGPDPAATLLAPLPDVIGELTVPVLTTLYEPRFMTSVDVVVRGRQEQQVGPMPVLYNNGPDDVTIRCDFGEIAPTDNASRDALVALRSALKRCVRYIVLDEGDLLVVDNKRALHGRVPFAARYDGADRWLLRAYVWATGNQPLESEHSLIVPATVFHGSDAC